MRAVTQDDLNAAARGLRMIALTPGELAALARQHRHDAPMFASRAIHHAAVQMRVAKLRMGARNA